MTLIWGSWPNQKKNKGMGWESALGFKHTFTSVGEWILTFSSSISLWELESCDVLSFWNKVWGVKFSQN
jgi:hypothetical protein